MDELLSKKPMMEFRGEGIYKILDVSKFIELLPDDGPSPIITMGAVKNEQDLDQDLLDEFRRARPKKPFYK